MTEVFFYCFVRLIGIYVSDNFSGIKLFFISAGEEPCYAGVPMSSIIEQGLGVGDVISLLWFKRSLPRYCTKFIEVGFF